MFGKNGQPTRRREMRRLYHVQRGGQRAAGALDGGKLRCSAPNHRRQRREVYLEHGLPLHAASRMLGGQSDLLDTLCEVDHQLLALCTGCAAL
jgi:hypothetical protein